MKRELLSRATKHAFRAARRARTPIGWAEEAKRRGLAWCTLMWPDLFFVEAA